MTACSHGMPTPASCIDCMDEGNIEPRRPRTWEPVGSQFLARFGGTCWTCDRPIVVSDVVQRFEDDERTVYAHGHCGAPR